MQSLLWYTSFTDCDSHVFVHIFHLSQCRHPQNFELPSTSVLCPFSIVNFFCPSHRVVGLRVVCPGRCVSCSRRSAAPLDAPSFLFHQRTQCFLKTAKVFLKVLYHRVIFVDSVPGHIVVSTKVYRCTFSASENCSVFWSQHPRFFCAFSQPLDCASPSVSHPTSKRSRSLSCLLLSDTFSFDAPVLKFFEYTTSIVLPSRVVVGSRP